MEAFADQFGREYDRLGSRDHHIRARYNSQPKQIERQLGCSRS
jgi:hypothetical protein